MNKHTQGPWRTGEHFRTMDIKAGHNALVARVEIESAGDKGFANAALIVEAPNLLEAAKEYERAIDAVISLCQQHDPATGHYKMVDPYEILLILQSVDICVKSRKAIRRAEGGAA